MSIDRTLDIALNSALIQRASDGCYFLSIDQLRECVSAECGGANLGLRDLMVSVLGDNSCGCALKIATGAIGSSLTNAQGTPLFGCGGQDLMCRV